MKTTGVVRRVDDLGRIVIPKELRKTLHIREGEELEVLVDEDNIILRKYSKLEELSVIANKIVEIASSMLGKTILIADRDNIICGAGDLKKLFVGKSVSKQLDKIISNEKNLVEKNISSIYITDDLEEKYSYVVEPIVYYGDVFGAVIMISPNSDIGEYDVSIIRLIKQFLGKYVEE